MITRDELITCIAQGRAAGQAGLEQALHDLETLIFFPLCWQACLIGSPAKFETDTDAFLPADLNRLQRLYLKSDCRFVYAPLRVAVAEA